MQASKAATWFLHAAPGLLLKATAQTEERTASIFVGAHIAIAPSNASLGSKLDDFGKHLQVDLESIFDLEVDTESDDPSVENPSKLFPLPNSFREILTNYVALLDELTFPSLLPLSMVWTSKLDTSLS